MNYLRILQTSSSLIIVLLLTGGQPSLADEPQEIVVTENRSPINILEIAGNTAVIDSYEIRITNPRHP